MFEKHRMMVHARKTLGRDVADAFLPAEAVAINAATQVTNCMAILVERHAAAGLTPATGATALAKMREAASLAMELRATMLEVHAHLSNDLRELSLLSVVEEFVPGCEPNSASMEPSQQEAA